MENGTAEGAIADLSSVTVEDTVTDVALMVDPTCRKGGSVEAGGLVWGLASPIPEE